ncbi:MAG: lipoyl domain-containing protein, partial [Bacteroidales bacterium]|nr:lipoyl domain-containing protein [Bacteroidales bacterium]
MILEIKIPSPGESVTEVAIGSWLVEDGDIVEKDQDVAEIESDKATLPLIAPASGKIKLMFKPGENIRVGDVACTIDTDFAKVNRENINKKSIDIQTSQKADDPSSLKQGNRISLPFDSNKKMNEPQEDI